MNAKNAHRIESMNGTSSKSTPVSNGVVNGGKEMTEEEKLQAILNQNDQSWKAEQEASSHKPIVRSYKSAAVPDKPLPPGYICHRCGKKGHWIQACPTNNDPDYDNRPKFKRTTGIPRSFLKVVEKPSDATDENGDIDVKKLPPGVMYTNNGEWVIAEADTATWNKIQEQHKVAAEKAKVVESGDQKLRDRGLECSIDKRMFVDPVKTPCCGETFCRDCIENTLLDSDLICPHCGEQALIDQLEPAEEVVKKMTSYQDEIKAEKTQKQKDASGSPATVGSPKGSVKAEDAPSGAHTNGATSGASTPNSKKRSAEEELPNDRKPANPADANAKKSLPNPSKPIPTGPKADMARAVQPPVAPARNLAEFQNQMNAMAGLSCMPPGGMPMGMNPMMGFAMNPMMAYGGGYNPAMMGFGGMPNYPMGMMNNGPWPGQTMNGNGAGFSGRGGFGHGRGGGAANGNDSPYQRQPVNPHRQRGRFQNNRPQDYRQL